jgi:hypothetical protein
MFFEFSNASSTSFQRLSNFLEILQAAFNLYLHPKLLSLPQAPLHSSNLHRSPLSTNKSISIPPNLNRQFTTSDFHCISPALSLSRLVHESLIYRMKNKTLKQHKKVCCG